MINTLYKYIGLTKETHKLDFNGTEKYIFRGVISSKCKQFWLQNNTNQDIFEFTMIDLAHVCIEFYYSEWIDRCSEVAK